MKKNLLYTFILLLASNLAFSQLAITPSFIEISATGSENLISQDIYITNDSESDLNVYWKLEFADSFSEDWEAQICDLFTCYLYGTYESATNVNAVNLIPAGSEVKFSLKVRRQDKGLMDGTTHGILRFYDDVDKTNEIAASSSPPVATNDLDLADMLIYPNPTTDMIQIKNDEEVSTINIYNVVGRQVSQLSHRDGEAHDVSALRQGIYLVRLENKNGDVVKAMRLSKR